MAITVLRGNAVKTASMTLQTNLSLNLTANTEDASTKDDAEGWDNQVVTSRAWTVQVDRLVENAGTTAEALLKKWIDQTASEAITVNVGSATVSGNALITQLDIDATVKQNVSISVTYTGDGACS